MGKLTNDVKKFLGDNAIWVFTTSSDKPNSGPVFFKKIDSKGNLVLFDVFMNKGLKNLTKNSNVAVTVFNAESLQGYQIRGTASYSTDSTLVKEGNALSGKMNLPTKGAVVIKVKEVFIQTPGPDVGKEIKPLLFQCLRK